MMRQVYEELVGLREIEDTNDKNRIDLIRTILKNNDVKANLVYFMGEKFIDFVGLGVTVLKSDLREDNVYNDLYEIVLDGLVAKLLNEGGR